MKKARKVMPKKIKITVTKQDIKNGVPGDGENCPIALAFKRVLGDSPNINNCNDMTVHDFFDTLHYYLGPEKVTKFINQFDETEYNGQTDYDGGWDGEGQDYKKINNPIPKPFTFVAKLKKSK